MTRHGGARPTLARRRTGRVLPPAHYRVARPGAGAFSISVAMLRDPQAWRDLLHAVIGFPVRLSTAVIALSVGLAGLGGASFAAWEWALPAGPSSATCA